MQPNNKVELVNFFKENKENIVAMCGDGANDCGALLCADIGISISHKKSTNITAHFYSEDDSISCVEMILKNGRACLENSVIICKFMIIYGIVQNCSIISLYSIGSSDLTNYQYLYLDCFTVLINCLVGSKYKKY
jgi:cation-transporting ATPase 13A3/4/5